MASKVPRMYTGLAGLHINPNPHKDLLQNFGRLIRMLEKLPGESKYKSDTIKVFKERKSIVESNPDRDEIEKKIGQGLCEELIEQARLEIKLVETMQKYKPWEPLEEKPQPNQWKWPL